MKNPIRFLPSLAAAVLLAGVARAQPARGAAGNAAGGAPTVPTIENLRTALTLTDAQAATIAPLLAEMAAAQKNVADLQGRYGTLRASLAVDAGASLTDPQKAQLVQLLAAPARGGRGGGGGGGGGAPAAQADQPSPRTDDNSKLAHEQHLAKKTQGKIDVYVEGDSIARRWGTSDAQYAPMLANWKENFFGWNVADFGWGADTLQNILWRLDNGELDGVNPKVIVFLGGTNNVTNAPNTDEKAQEIARGIKAILTRFQQKAPTATVVLTGIFARNNGGPTFELIKKINAIVATYADGKKVRYLDVNDKLADANGIPLPGMMGDGLHPTPKGYQVWADGLKPILTELLGPPAKEDHAPPPTGDPSATRPATPAPSPASGG